MIRTKLGARLGLSASLRHRNRRRFVSLGSRPPRFLTMSAPGGDPFLRRQHTPPLGQDHPREAPPVSDAPAVNVILEVIALPCSELDRAFRGELVEPSMVLPRQ